MKLVMLIFSVLALTVLGLAMSARTFLIAGDQVDHAAFCHVLSGNRKRVDFAIQLYDQGLCAKILLIGGGHDTARSHASRQKAHAVDQGVPAKDVIIDETVVHTTYQEIVRVGEMVSQRGPPAATVTHVTDAFHTRRVRMVSDWVLGGSLDVQMAPVPFETSYFAEDWWWDRRSRKLVTTEYIKIAFYFFRYRLPFPPLNNFLARFETLND